MLNRDSAPKNPPAPKDLDQIIAVLNSGDERSVELKNLIERWKTSGKEHPDLQKMVNEDEDLGRDLRDSWPAVWVPGRDGRAYYVPLPGGVGHDRDNLIRRARFLFAALVLNPSCHYLGGPCERCKVYFRKRRMSMGRFCGQRCAGLASASRSTKKRDRELREAKLKLAARYWTQWSARTGQVRTFWVAKKANRAQRKIVLTKKFVSRNQKTIEGLALTRR